MLLPEGMGNSTTGIHAVQERQKRNWFAPRCYFEYQAAARCLQSTALQPGTYRLENYDRDSIETIGDLSDVRVEVKAGENATVDLRARKVGPPPIAARPKAWTTVTVKHHDQPLSGAEVTVFADVEHPADVARWIEELKSHDPEVRRSAVVKLKLAGAQAVDAVNAALPPSQADKLLADLKTLDSDGLELLSADLSDDVGHTRCEVETGRRCVAVARVRGRLIGWREFTAGGGPVSVEMHAARTLAVHLKTVDDQREGRDDLTPWIGLAKPSGVSARALMRVIGRLGEWAGTPVGTVPGRDILQQRWPMPEDGPSAWVLEDLPAGETCEVELRGRPSGDGEPKASQKVVVRLGSGPGVEQIEW